MGESLLALVLAGLLSWAVGLVVDLARRRRHARPPPAQLPAPEDVVVFRPRNQARPPRRPPVPRPPLFNLTRPTPLASAQYRAPTRCRICDHPFDHPVHLSHVQP